MAGTPGLTLNDEQAAYTVKPWYYPCFVVSPLTLFTTDVFKGGQPLSELVCGDISPSQTEGNGNGYGNGSKQQAKARLTMSGATPSAEAPSLLQK